MENDNQVIELKEEITKKNATIQSLVSENAALREELFFLKERVGENFPRTDDQNENTHHSPTPLDSLTEQEIQEIRLHLDRGAKHLAEDKMEFDSCIQMLKESSLFLNDWYLKTYPDVAENSKDPQEHYLLHGASEGRDPSPDFNTLFYCRFNRDVVESGLNPLIHYISNGKAEGRKPRP